jgi:hypothetical protein
VLGHTEFRTGIDICTYQTGASLGGFFFPSFIPGKYCWYWVFFLNFHTSLVLVLGPRLIFAWCIEGIKLILVLVDVTMYLIFSQLPILY